MKIDSSDLNKIREAGLLVSLPFVAGHIAYPDGVVIGKPEGIGGNSTTDHRAKWSLDGPYLDAPTLYLHAEREDLWFVSLEEYEPGPGPGDFRNKWSTPEEALADVMSFFFGDSTRMRKSC